MAITISGENNNDKILASDGVIDQISGINIVGVITATSFTGDLTGNVTGNLTGNVNSTSPLLLQTGGSERIRLTGNNEIGIAGANYGTSGQVLTSGGSGSAVSWTTIPTQITFSNPSNNRILTSEGGIGVNCEANLTWDGNKIHATATGEIARFQSTNSVSTIRLYSTASSHTEIGHTEDTYIAVGGSERLRIKGSNGAVGINTDSPGRRLHVYGGFGAANLGHPLLLERGDGSNTQIEIKAAGVTRGFWGASSTANFMVYDNDTSDINFVVNQDGTIGQGTTSPDDLFHISTSQNAAKGLRITNTNNSQASAIARVFISGGDNAKAALRLETNGQFHDIFERNTGELTIEDNGTERLRIDSSGRITGKEPGTGHGMGGIIASTANAGGNAGFGFMTAGTQRFNITTIGSSGSEALRVYDVNNSVERLRIDSDGNIGAGGITSPLWTSGGGIHLNDNYGIGFGNGGSGRPDFQLMVTDGSTLQFRCGFGADTADINMDTNGRLLINSTAPSISSSELFEVKSGGQGFSHFRNNSSSYATIYIDNEYSDTGFAPFITFTDGGGNRGGIGQDQNDLLRITGQGGFSVYTAGTHGSGNERFKVAQAGQVTMPAQPSFMANFGSTNNTSHNNGDYLKFSNTDHNTGNCYNTSNYRFTAPVAGNYLFYGRANMSGATTNDYARSFQVRLYKNGSSEQYHMSRTTLTGYSGSYPDTSTMVCSINLNANDYVQLKVNWETDGTMSSTENFHHHGSMFGGYLIG